MFKSLKIARSRQPLSHEQLFMERYGRVLEWSLKITDGDMQLAEDLVHDAFIQFSLSRQSTRFAPAK